MTTLHQLISSYERMAKTAKKMSDDHSRACDWDVLAIQKLDTKADLYQRFARELRGLLSTQEELVKALHAQITETQMQYQTILDIEYRGKASGVELYDCVADEAIQVLDKLSASIEKPKMYQP